MTEALGKIMEGSTGSQWGKYHKKRDNRRRSKQKERNSKGYYSFKGKKSKETYEVRYRMNSQSRSCNRQRGMVRLRHTHRKRSPLGKEFPESSRQLTRMEQAAK
jgi:hypothetical protein